MALAPSTVKWVLKPAAFLAALLPVAWMVWAGLTGNLSANPLSDITNETGVWALRFHLHHAGDHAAPPAHRLECR